MPVTETMVAPSRGEEVVWDKQVTNGGGALLADQNGRDVLGVVRGGGVGGGEDEGEGENPRCGLGVCSPHWMQAFASKQAFLVTFCITWVLQGMYYTYFVSVITTIEKLFQLQSKTTGVIMSATEIGQIGSSLLLTYYGGQGHRPKWIACGMVLFALASFTCSLPHFIFGQQLMQSRETMFAAISPVNSSGVPQPAVCHAADPLSVLGLANMSALDNEECQEEALQEQHSQTKTTEKVLVIFFVSLLGVGMGQTAVYTLGIPYIDDNVASRESPLYFAITIGVRILGPALGFILGSLCTLLYVDLSVDPPITPKDPRWVGAWWLGLVCISALLMLASLAMFAFPKRLSTCRVDSPSAKKREKNPSLRDFPKAIKRLLKNDILMFRTASSVLHILPIAGLYTFLPKYLESQFRQTAHTANMVSGIGGILVMGLGIIMSGVFILRVKPNARFVAAWIAFTALLYAIGMGILMTIGCPMDDFAGLKIGEGFNVATFESPCKLDCNCNMTKFNPVCGADMLTYYSPCHAGCLNYTLSKDSSIVEQFTECSCMSAPEQMTERIGVCETQCNNFVWYMVLFSISVFVHSTSEVGSMLLILRCVDPRDKAMALGLIQFAIGLFGNVPCPIVYGAIVDSACLLWDTVCGKKGACRLYDTKMFRLFFHGTTAAIMFCAFFVDLIVWYKAGSINFVDEQTTRRRRADEFTSSEESSQDEEELNPMTEKTRSETSV